VLGEFVSHGLEGSGTGRKGVLGGRQLLPDVLALRDDSGQFAVPFLRFPLELDEVLALEGDFLRQVLVLDL
jgi:hypothetical protein